MAVPDDQIAAGQLGHKQMDAGLKQLGPFAQRDVPATPAAGPSSGEGGDSGLG